MKVQLGFLYLFANAPLSGQQLYGWYALLGIFVFLLFITFVGKVQAHPILRKARINQFTAGVGVLFLIALLKMGSDWHKVDLYNRNGVLAQASVTRKFTETRILPIHNYGTDYIVAYEYVDSTGAKHSGEDYVRSQIWNSLSAGGSVEIKYLADRPADSAVNAWDGYYESIHVSIALAVVSGGALLWGLRRPAGRQRHNSV